MSAARKMYGEVMMQNAPRPSVGILTQPGIPRDLQRYPGLINQASLSTTIHPFSPRFRAALLAMLRSCSTPAHPLAVARGAAPPTGPHDLLTTLFQTRYLHPSLSIIDPHRAFQSIDALASYRPDVAAAASATLFPILSPIALAATHSSYAEAVLAGVSSGAFSIAYAPLERCGTLHPALTVPPAYTAATFDPMTNAWTFIEPSAFARKHLVAAAGIAGGYGHIPSPPPPPPPPPPPSAAGTARASPGGVVEPFALSSSSASAAAQQPSFPPRQSTSFPPPGAAGASPPLPLAFAAVVAGVGAVRPGAAAAESSTPLPLSSSFSSSPPPFPYPTSADLFVTATAAAAASTEPPRLGIRVPTHLFFYAEASVVVPTSASSAAAAAAAAAVVAAGGDASTAGRTADEAELVPFGVLPFLVELRDLSSLETLAGGGSGGSGGGGGNGPPSSSLSSSSSSPSAASQCASAVGVVPSGTRPLPQWPRGCIATPRDAHHCPLRHGVVVSAGRSDGLLDVSIDGLVAPAAACVAPWMVPRASGVMDAIPALRALCSGGRGSGGRSAGARAALDGSVGGSGDRRTGSRGVAANGEERVSAGRRSRDDGDDDGVGHGGGGGRQREGSSGLVVTGAAGAAEGALDSDDDERPEVGMRALVGSFRPVNASLPASSSSPPPSSITSSPSAAATTLSSSSSPTPSSALDLSDGPIVAGPVEKARLEEVSAAAEHVRRQQQRAEADAILRLWGPGLTPLLRRVWRAVSAAVRARLPDRPTALGGSGASSNSNSSGGGAGSGLRLDFDAAEGVGARRFFSRRGRLRGAGTGSGSDNGVMSVLLGRDIEGERGRQLLVARDLEGRVAAAEAEAAEMARLTRFAEAQWIARQRASTVFEIPAMVAAAAIDIADARMALSIAYAHALAGAMATTLVTLDVSDQSASRVLANAASASNAFHGGGNARPVLRQRSLGGAPHADALANAAAAATSAVGGVGGGGGGSPQSERIVPAHPPCHELTDAVALLFVLAAGGNKLRALWASVINGLSATVPTFTVVRSNHDAALAAAAAAARRSTASDLSRDGGDNSAAEVGVASLPPSSSMPSSSPSSPPSLPSSINVDVLSRRIDDVAGAVATIRVTAAAHRVLARDAAQRIRAAALRTIGPYAAQPHNRIAPGQSVVDIDSNCAGAPTVARCRRFAARAMWSAVSDVAVLRRRVVTKISLFVPSAVLRGVAEVAEHVPLHMHGLTDGTDVGTLLRLLEIRKLWKVTDAAATHRALVGRIVEGQAQRAMLTRLARYRVSPPAAPLTPGDQADAIDIMGTTRAAVADDAVDAAAFFDAAEAAVVATDATRRRSAAMDPATRSAVGLNPGVEQRLVLISLQAEVVRDAAWFLENKLLSSRRMAGLRESHRLERQALTAHLEPILAALGVPTHIIQEAPATNVYLRDNPSMRHRSVGEESGATASSAQMRAAPVAPSAKTRVDMTFASAATQRAVRTGPFAL